MIPFMAHHNGDDDARTEQKALLWLQIVRDTLIRNSITAESVKGEEISFMGKRVK